MIRHGIGIEGDITTTRRNNDFPLFYGIRFARRHSTAIYPWDEKHSEGLRYFAIDWCPTAVFTGTGNRV